MAPFYPESFRRATVGGAAEADQLPMIKRNALEVANPDGEPKTSACTSTPKPANSGSNALCGAD